MGSIEIKEKLIKEIKQVDDVQLLEALYTILTSGASEEVYHLSEDQISVIEEAREQYRKDETFTNEEVDREIEEEYIANLVASGEYHNTSEVISDALKLHESYRKKVIEDLRKEIDFGWDGPDSSMTMDEIIESLRKS